MLSLDDPRWATLLGGYRVPYDASRALRSVQREWVNEPAWEELFAQLHHQGDVGEASYAALAVLAGFAADVRSRGWMVYALAATIETERHAARNPPVPKWLEHDYANAWKILGDLALIDLRSSTDHQVIQTALAVVALAKGVTKLGVLIAWLDDSDLDEFLNERLDWSYSYNRQ